jgi:hypothetical protein
MHRDVRLTRVSLAAAGRPTSREVFLKMHSPGEKPNDWSPPTANSSLGSAISGNPVFEHRSLALREAIERF